MQSTNFFKCPREEVPNGVFGPTGWNLQLHLGLFDPQHLVVQMGIVQPNVYVVQTTHNFRVKSRVALPSFSHLFLRMALKRSYLEILFVPPLLLLFHRTSKSGWRESRRMLAPAFSSENSHCLCFLSIYWFNVFSWKIMNGKCSRPAKGIPVKKTFVLGIAQIGVGPTHLKCEGRS